MAPEFGELATDVAMKGIPIIAIGVMVIILVTALIIISIVLYKRKKWNLKGTVYLLRNNLKEQFEDNCKGYWDANEGWIVLKRKGYKPVHTRPFDPKKWLVGRDRFHVIQVGPEDFIISRLEWNEIIDEETNEPVMVSKIISDVGKRKTWKNYTERMGKNAFTLKGWADKHQFAIALSVVIFCMFLGFAILWMKLPSICAVG